MIKIVDMYRDRLKLDPALDWQMSPEDKACLIDTLSDLRPEVAIEIGTFRGGSLQVVQAFARDTYSIDISEEPKSRLSAKFPNVHFLVGPSTRILPELLEKLSLENRTPGFILVDGDHSKEGVQTDLHTILSYPYRNPVTVFAHDCFNPQCRAGIVGLDYSRYSAVKSVEIDHVLGKTVRIDGLQELWGGFARILVDPNSTKHYQFINEHQKEYEQAYKQSSHSISDRLLSPLKKMVRKLLAR